MQMFTSSQCPTMVCLTKYSMIRIYVARLQEALSEEFMSLTNEVSIPTVLIGINEFIH